MLVHEPRRVITLALPRTSTGLSLQVKVRLCWLPVMRISSALAAGGGWRVGGVTVGSTAVGDRVGTKVGAAVSVGTVAVSMTRLTIQPGPAIWLSVTSGPSVPTLTVPDTSSPE